MSPKREPPSGRPPLPRGSPLLATSPTPAGRSSREPAPRLEPRGPAERSQKVTFYFQGVMGEAQNSGRGITLLPAKYSSTSLAMEGSVFAGQAGRAGCVHPQGQ